MRTEAKKCRAVRSGLLLLVAFLSLAKTTTAQDPPCRRYTMADGLPSNTVYSAIQDHEGFLWFGTDAGVSRFDGHTFTNYGLADGLMDNEVIACAEDSKGRIWFLLLNGRLCYFKDGVVHNEFTDPVLVQEKVLDGARAFEEDAQGRLWFAGVHARLRVLKPSLELDTVHEFNSPLPGVISVAHDRNGQVLVAHRGIVYAEEHRALVRKYGLFHLISGTTAVSARIPGGETTLLTARGLLGVRVDTASLIVPLAEGIDTLVHEKAWVDGDGYLWMYRKDHGIDLFEPQANGFGRRRTLLEDDVVNHAFVDDEGDRWFTTRRGVLVNPNTERAVQVFRGTMGDVGEGINELFRDRDGQTWVGSDRGLLYRFDGKRLIDLGVGQGCGRIHRIRETADGQLLVASDHRLLSLSVHPERKAVSIGLYIPYTGATMDDAPARTVECGPSGNVYTSYMGLYRMEHRGKDTVMTRWNPEMVDNIRIYAVHEDRHGRVWYESGESLNVIDRDTHRSFPGLNALTGVRISDIASYRGDTLVLATTGKGILLVLEGKAIASTQGTAANPLIDVRRVRMQGDTIWTAGMQGVQAFVLRDGALIGTAWFAQDRGLPVSDARDVMVQDGRLLVATAQGLCVLDLDPSRIPVEAPRVRLANVFVNDVPRRVDDVLRIRAGDERLRLIVRAITFADPDHAEYQYRLDGNASWGAMDDGRVDLVSLAAGDYTFEARARKAGGPWSGPVTLLIHVQPPWYARPAVMVSAWAGLTGLLVAAGAWVMRRQQRERMQRLAELNMLNEERRRIAADVHDDLGADLSHLLIRAQNALEQNDQLQGRTSLAALSDGLRGTMEKIDEIIWSLDPGRDNLRATADFIEGWVRTYTHMHGLQFRSDIVGLSPDVALHAIQRRELALVVKEAVRNIVKHAQATTVHLAVAVVGPRLRIILVDDGKVSPAGVRANGRSGLGNMRRRAERLGGWIRFEQLPGQGTRFTVEIPVQEGASPDMVMPDGPPVTSLPPV